MNNGEENELEKLPDGLLRRIFLPLLHRLIFVFSDIQIRWTGGTTNNI